MEGLEEVFLESFVNFEQTPYLPRLRTGSLDWNTSHEIPLRGTLPWEFWPLAEILLLPRHSVQFSHPISKH